MGKRRKAKPEFWQRNLPAPSIRNDYVIYMTPERFQEDVVFYRRDGLLRMALLDHSRVSKNG
jgi:hypothetical protein